MDNKENPLKDKSYKFALRIVKLYQHLADERKEYVLSKQILRSGTSIGANVTEGNQAQSKSDFVHKLSIAHKEAFETEYLPTARFALHYRKTSGIFTDGL